MIAATNRIPEEVVTEGKLREDILYCLQVFPFHLPRCASGRNIELLAKQFLIEMNPTDSAVRKRPPRCPA